MFEGIEIEIGCLTGVEIETGCKLAGVEVEIEGKNWDQMYGISNSSLST